MATHDYILANQSGSSFRSDLNNALAAIVSQNSSATAPATTYSYQYWIDTSATPALIKQRNAANDAWITLAEVDGQTLIADGDNAKPGLAFASDINTGIKRESNNKMSFVTAGSPQVTVDSSGVGFGTSSPAAKVDVSGDSPKIRLTDTDTALSDGELSSAIEFYQSDSSGAGLGASVVARGDGSTGLLALCFNARDNSEKMRIAANGNVGIGTTPDTLLHIASSQGGSQGRIKFDCNVSSGYDTLIEATDVGLEFTAKSTSRGFAFKTGSTPTTKMDMNGSGYITMGAGQAASNAILSVKVAGSGVGSITSESGTTSSRNHMRFKNPNGLVGSNFYKRLRNLV